MSMSLFRRGFKWGEEMKRKSKFRRYLSGLLALFLISVFLYSTYELSRIAYDYYNNQKVLAEVQEIYERPVESVKTEEATDVRSEFDKLHAINEDIVGWVEIDGTKINYPILQAPNNDYYLTRNYKHETSRAGSIFMDYRNQLKEEKNMILYGHRMKDESMFQQLTKYENENFLKEHQEILFDTLYESFDAEVFSVYYTTTDFDYIQTEFESLGEYQALLKEIQEKSLHETDIEIKQDDRILTLSTCDYSLDPDEGRFVVHAKVNESK